MASRARATGLSVLFQMYVSSILLWVSFCSHEVIAWRGTTRSIRPPCSTNTRFETALADPALLRVPAPVPSARRELLFLIPRVMAATAATTSATVTLPRQALAAAPADAARSQWKNAVVALDELLQNWSAESDPWANDVGGGDVLRARLGTQGTSSSLYQIEKAFRALRNSEYVDDEIDFQETSEEFMDALYRADSMASSSNNKTGSGSQTPPAVFIERSKSEVIRMQSIAKKLNAMVK